MLLVVALGYGCSGGSNTSRAPDDHHHEHEEDHKHHKDDMNHSGHQDEAHMDHAHHDHGMVETSEYENIPTISLVGHVDAVGGINIEILAENFVFTPENVNGENIDGEGHTHLYINGKKITRVYNPWFLISKGLFDEGENTITVELSANNHNYYVLNGEKIEDTITVMVDDGEITLID